jgi:predicted ATPase/DNA-binding winged helix-turn-helix (wHTH) protein
MTTIAPFRAGETAAFGPFRLTPTRRLLIKGEQAVVIGGRALDILIALLERPGQVVGRRELIDRVWPNVTVDDRSLRVHLTGLRRVLGDGEDGARYIANVSGRGYRFVADVQRSSGTVASSPIAEMAPPVRTANLPAPLARVIGRQKAIERVRALLAAGRLISIVAPGGMGKTTVGVALAHALLHDFDDSVCFVDLAAITDETLVVSAVASAVIDITQTTTTLPGLLSGLADKHLLLVLDNCEHVIEAVASLVERMLSAAERVHILATTREPLRVEGEIIYRLPPLESPLGTGDLSASEAQAASAVQLFLERSEASGHRIELTDADAPAVAAICRHLDGIALAIELAASRVGMYGIRGVADLLERRFGLLWEGRRTALPRHQTLRATLDWSYNLLSPDEQTILCRLSVFAGYFTLDGAVAVSAETGVQVAEVAEAVTSLINKSLIWNSEIEGTVYHRLLDTTRAYARAKLDNNGDGPAVERRHAFHYADFLSSALFKFSPDGYQDMSPLSPHLGNVRVALGWSFSESGDTAVGVRLAAHAAPLFLSLSLLAECERWSTCALSAISSSDRGTETELALLAAAAVSSMFAVGNSGEVRATIERGLALAVTLSARGQQLQLLAGLSIFLSRTAAFREALAVAERIIAVAEQIDDQPALVMAEWMIGVSHHLIGNQAAAQLHCERGFQYATERNILQVTFFRFNHRVRAQVALARCLWLRGQPMRSIESAQQVVHEAISDGQAVDLCSTLTYAIPVFIWNNRLDDAESLIERLVNHAVRNSLAPYHAVGIALRGELAVARGDAAAGVPLLRRALSSMRADRHTVLLPGFCRVLAEGLALAGNFDEAAATIAEAMTLAQQGGESFDLPNLLRADAEIRMLGPRPDLTAAEALLLQSIEHAERQSAPAWQLHSAIPLARLWVRQQRRIEATDLLSRVRRQFTSAPGKSYPAASRAVGEDPSLFMAFQH